MMTDAGKILMLIPARGGSKRLPRKNILPMAGKPLICWTIEAALATELDARIMVSSDDEEVLDIAHQYSSRGVVAYRRPDELATDTASTVEVVIDAINAEKAQGYEPKIIILLQPTSPLRTTEDIHASLKVFEEGGRKDTVVSVCEVDHPTAWVGYIEKHSYLDGVDFSGARSQDYKKEYCLNGAIYVADVDLLCKQSSLFTTRVKAAVMPRIRSIDIDSIEDFELSEAVFGVR
ncbi:acylneuraminate cytidylyltransferase family protein [Halomonas sp. PGE1]|uniref:acylneuraminate cytidylyltransferase family protein n=1 Tax=Halomonas sp. PGE1 TaxID=2730360 RepID=UPI00147403FB|nr:acylneuraminate cytidylyltransferase family protein [Halomonas sp. PGE1]QJQ99361.1 acylneuraminate cytidylyltransferase family protein [Halomonas sp. PGE1]